MKRSANRGHLKSIWAKVGCVLFYLGLVGSILSFFEPLPTPENHTIVAIGQIFSSGGIVTISNLILPISSLLVMFIGWVISIKIEY